MQKTVVFGLIAIFGVSAGLMVTGPDGGMAEMTGMATQTNQSSNGNLALMTFTIVSAQLILFRRAMLVRKLRRRPKTRISTKAAQVILIMMCRICQSERDITAEDVTLIQRVFARMTKRRVTVAQICDIIEKDDAPLRPADIRDMSASLTPHERAALMKVSLMMTVSQTGEANTSNTLFVQLAKALRVSGDDLGRFINQVTPTRLSPAVLA